MRINRFSSHLLYSNMYIIENEKSIIVIDPFEDEDTFKDYLDNNFSLDYIFLTHEHYDHISGVNFLKKKFETKVVCSSTCGELIKDPSANFSKYFEALAMMIPQDKAALKVEDVKPYATSADLVFNKKLILNWEGMDIIMYETPGHSQGSCCLILNNDCLFSGDSLLKDYPVVTKLKGGSKRSYESISKPFLESLPKGMKIYPGHFEEFEL
ncbi:MAG: MBL fold metallo-hydrolase [Ignavibacteriales bacterium]|nr:MBL fold metallo-hydrolase [Ignavibacteriales bacterium]